MGEEDVKGQPKVVAGKVPARADFRQEIMKTGIDRKVYSVEDVSLNFSPASDCFGTSAF